MASSGVATHDSTGDDGVASLAIDGIVSGMFNETWDSSLSNFLLLASWSIIVTNTCLSKMYCLPVPEIYCYIMKSIRKSCSHSGDLKDGWWNLQFPEPTPVEKVVIYNREDCCQDRINDVKVWSIFFPLYITQFAISQNSSDMCWIHLRSTAVDEDNTYFIRSMPMVSFVERSSTWKVNAFIRNLAVATVRNSEWQPTSR